MPLQTSTTAASPVGNGHDHDSHNSDDAEQQPLLVSSATVKPSPLPQRAITILLIMRLAEPINFTIIFPFINDLVFSLLPPSSTPASVGFYAGIVESLFSLSQTLTILFWGSLSDRIGRKPVLITGLIGVACSAVLFGLSKSFTWAVLARSMAGATNGNVAIVKSVMGELTVSDNRARAFSLLPLTWTVGCLIGPLLGGYLSKPSEKYPKWFAREASLGLGGVWEVYPYLLPCAVSACITAASIGFGALMLEETLPEIVERNKKRKQQQQQEVERRTTVSNYGSLDHNVMDEVDARSIGNGDSHATTRRQRTARRASSSSSIHVSSWYSGFTPTSSPPPSPPPSSSPPAAPVSVLELLSIAQIQRVMISYAFLALISVALDSVFVLYLYEPVDLGGVSFSSSSTGLLLSINGLGGALVQLLLFPPLQKRLGTLRLYTWSMFAFPLSVVLLPVANAIARAGQGERYTEAVWACLLISTAIRVVGGLAYASNMILVNQCSTLTRATALGRLNSLAQMSSSISRAIGPYLANTLFAVSVTKGTC